MMGSELATEFPTFLLPLILPKVKDINEPDLFSLLAVCCVSREWKAAAESLPELWGCVDVPEKYNKRLTDERLYSILKKSNGLGLSKVCLRKCVYITDKSIRALQRILFEVPYMLNLNCCTRVTWRSVIHLAKHYLKLLRKQREDRRRDPEKYPRTLWTLSVSLINWKGCPGHLFKECFVDTPLTNQLHGEVRYCEICQRVEKAASCEFCLEYLYEIECKLEAARCVCCRKRSCSEHLDESPFLWAPSGMCNHSIAEQCLKEARNKHLICSQCEDAICPKCNSARQLAKQLLPCLSCGKTVCIQCRLNNTVCRCKYAGLEIERFKRMKFPALCHPCVAAASADPTHKLRTEGRKLAVLDGDGEDSDAYEAPAPALRLCNTCGKLRTYDGEFDTDESSGREDARSLGSTEDSDGSSD